MLVYAPGKANNLHHGCSGKVALKDDPGELSDKLVLSYQDKYDECLVPFAGVPKIWRPG